nr:MAG TPA: tail fiber assembly protein [Caudoviricetes sp.]
MKKFIVDKIKIIEDKDFKYIGIYDEKDNDWYKEQKEFNSETLKVMYNKDSLLVLSTSKDVSVLAPTMVGDVVEEIEYQEVKVNPNLYFVDGKVVELQNYETIKNGKIVFDRDKRIEEIKKELYDLRVERDIAPFEFEVDGVTYLQNNRSIDQSNLTRIVVMCQALKKTTFENWKFYTKENSEKYVNLTIQDMMKMANIMQEQTTKSMAAETLLTHNLENLTDKELKEYDAKDKYEKAYKNI